MTNRKCWYTGLKLATTARPWTLCVSICDQKVTWGARQISKTKSPPDCYCTRWGKDAYEIPDRQTINKGNKITKERHYSTERREGDKETRWHTHKLLPSGDPVTPANVASFSALFPWSLSSLCSPVTTKVLWVHTDRRKQACQTPTPESGSHLVDPEDHRVFQVKRQVLGGTEVRKTLDTGHHLLDADHLHDVGHHQRVNEVDVGALEGLICWWLYCIQLHFKNSIIVHMCAFLWRKRRF